MVTSVPSNLERQNFSNFRSANGTLIPITIHSAQPWLARRSRQYRPGEPVDPAAESPRCCRDRINGCHGQPLPFNNYAVTPAATSTAHAFDVRVDHEFAPGNTVFVRHSFQNTQAVSPSIFGQPLGGTLLGAGPTYARNQNFGIGHTWKFGPWLNDVIR
jgi:hypothetical protein